MAGSGDIRAGGAYVEVYADPRGVKTGLDGMIGEFGNSKREIKSILAELSGMQGGAARDMVTMFSEGMEGGLLGGVIAGVALGVAAWAEYNKSMAEVRKTYAEIRKITEESTKALTDFAKSVAYSDQAMSAETGAERFAEGLKEIQGFLNSQVKAVEEVKSKYVELASEQNRLIEDWANPISALQYAWKGVTGEFAKTAAEAAKLDAILRSVQETAAVTARGADADYVKKIKASTEQEEKPARIAARTEELSQTLPEDVAKKQAEIEEKNAELRRKKRDEAGEEIKRVQDALQIQRQATADRIVLAKTEAEKEAERLWLKQKEAEAETLIANIKKNAGIYDRENLKRTADEIERMRLEAGKASAIKMGEQQETARTDAGDAERKLAIAQAATEEEKKKAELADKIARINEEADKKIKASKSGTETEDIKKARDAKIEAAKAEAEAAAIEEGSKKLSDEAARAAEAMKSADAAKVAADAAGRKLAIEQETEEYKKRQLETTDKIATLEEQAGKATFEAKSDAEKADIARKLQADKAAVQAAVDAQDKKEAEALWAKEQAEANRTEQLKDQLAVAQALTPEAKRQAELAAEMNRIQRELDAGSLTKEQADLERQIAEAKNSVQNQSKVDVMGTFNAAAVWGMGGTVQERIAAATERTAKNTESLANFMQSFS